MRNFSGSYVIFVDAKFVSGDASRARVAAGAGHRLHFITVRGRTVVVRRHGGEPSRAVFPPAKTKTPQ
jgi:hypothetical protein